MSRIGKKPISVPSGVRVTIDPQNRTVSVEGPKGELSMTHRPEVAVTWEEGENRIICSIPMEKSRSGQLRAYWGLTRALVNNMIIGVGWGAKLQGKQLELNVGYCQPRVMTVPDNIDLVVDKGVITVSGTDKQAVGQFAARVRKHRPPEPYNGKGIKYSDEIIIRKQGKVFGS